MSGSWGYQVNFSGYKYSTTQMQHRTLTSKSIASAWIIAD